jgi:HEAT repeat protein
MRLYLFVALAVVVGGCGGPAKPTQVHDKPLAYWLETLRGSDAQARRKAVVVLGNVGAVDDAIVPALIDAVRDRDPAVRREAMLALLKIGPEAEAAIPVLQEAARDKDAKVRQAAAAALKHIEAQDQ